MTRSIPPASLAPFFPQQGFTLIEVLVAMVILALGAGGVAAMQLHALRIARQSAYQTIAVQLAAELAEHMRASLVPYAAPAASLNNAYLFEYQAATAPPLNGSATDDIGAWQQRLRHSLPQGRAVVCRDSLPAEYGALRWPCDHAAQSAVVIKIGWSGRDHAVQTETSPAMVMATEF